MYKGKRIAVIIPAYNEAEFVGEVIETVPSFVDRIYPVDDCSTDDTWHQINRSALKVTLGAGEAVESGEQALADGGNRNRVIPLQHDENRGVGGAIATGYKRALADDIDAIAVMNADGQMDPDILDRILDPVVEGKVDYAKGNRLLSEDHWEGMTRFRLFGNWTLTYLTRIASGYWQMTDPQNGYTAISAEALSLINLEALYDEYGFLNDLLIHLNANDMRIADVEMSAVYGEESSSIKYRQFIPKLSWLLLRNFLWRLKTKYGSGDRVVAVPYITGIGGTMMLFAYLVASVWVFGHYATLTASVVALLISVLFILLGMWLEQSRSAAMEIIVRK
jgi:glycosyltransferase involved in cell wall biosynthesis